MIGDRVMLDFNIVVFTGGSWLNPSNGRCKGLHQKPLAPRPVWKGWDNKMSGIAMPLRCKGFAHMFLSVSMFTLCLCKNAKLFIKDVVAREEFNARSHVGRSWHAQCLGVR